MPDPVEMDKAKLLAQATEERRRLESLLERLDQEQMLRPVLPGDWSVKDVLVHVAAWEERMGRWLSEALRGEVPDMPGGGLTWADLDRINAQTYMEGRERPLDEVLARFHSVHSNAMRVVEGAAEDALLDAARYPWRNGRPLWQMVAANTFWHYSEHGQAIKDRLLSP